MLELVREVGVRCFRRRRSVGEGEDGFRGLMGEGWAWRELLVRGKWVRGRVETEVGLRERLEGEGVEVELGLDLFR